ncbi:MAG: hypothetical protein ACXVNN_10950 [Bacteroidia bacterium]
MKPIYYLSIPLIFIFSCNGQNKIQLPKDHLSESKKNHVQQSLLNIPWMDPSLLPVSRGC